jgi:hypothetical protein
MAKRVNYLNNKDMLVAIHKSKLSYCWIKDEKYNLFDHIISSLDEINEEAIAIAKQTRASRMQKAAHEAEVKRWENGELERKTKPRGIDFAVDPQTIDEKEIVFRLMTFDHIPLEKRKNNPKTVADHHSRCNFPPFKHIALYRKKWSEVARSHWNGTVKDGTFSITHGNTTPTLAKMYLKLCERYSMRSNWRGYTYVDEMRGQALLQLSQIGLQFNEEKSQNPFAYYTTAINNSFTRVLNLEKRNQNIRDDLLEEAGLEPSYTRTFNTEFAKKIEDEENAKINAAKETNKKG